VLLLSKKALADQLGYSTAFTTHHTCLATKWGIKKVFIHLPKPPTYGKISPKDEKFKDLFGRPLSVGDK
jgi:hypothetical protein